MTAIKAYVSPPIRHQPIRLTSFHRRAALALLLTGLLILCLMRFTAIDIALADIYFDTQRQVFPWKSSWFAKNLMHGDVKWGLQAVALMICGFTVSDWIKPWLSSSWLRVRLRFVALSAVLIPLVITLCKRGSTQHCPWDIDRYGGHYPHLSFFDAIPAHMPYGHCFPAGHASTGLWLAALAVFWLPHQPRRAWQVCWLGLAVGFALGWVQQMRGAHFFTHTLMSVWIACCILLILHIYTPQLNEK